MKSKMILYNGDAYNDIKLIPDNSIDLIYVDIPYEFVKGGRGGAFGKDERKYNDEMLKASVNTSATDNDRIFASIKEKLSGKKDLSKAETGINYDILNEFIRVLKKINCYIWCSKEQIPVIMDYFVNRHKCTFDIITWHKTNPVPKCNDTYLPDTEYCLFFREKGVAVNGSYATKSKFYVSPLNKKDKDKYGHPCIKPLEFCKNHILNSTNEGDVVLDCFMGSGTTGVACKELNRDFIGIEINEEFFKIANERINNAKTVETTKAMTIFDFL